MGKQNADSSMEDRDFALLGAVDTNGEVANGCYCSEFLVSPRVLREAF